MAQQIGFPKTLSNEASSFSLPEGVSSYQVKVVPSNLSQISSIPTALGTAAAALANINLPNTSTNIIFDLPVGGNKSLFLDNRLTFLCFRVAYTVTSPNAQVFTTCNLRSNALSFFNRMYTESNGIILDDIPNLDVVQDFCLNNSFNVADRDSVAILYGLNYEVATGGVNSNQGHSLQGISGTTLSATTTVYYSYCIPLTLNSIIGQNARKMLNIGALNNLRVNLQTSNVVPVNMSATGNTAAGVFSCVMDNISIVCQYLDIGLQAYQLLNKSETQVITSETYRVSTNTLPSGVSGTQQLLVGIRGSSVHYIASRFQNSDFTAAGSWNGIFDSKVPAASSICYNIAGQLYPSNNLDLLRNPAQVFMETQKAFGNFDGDQGFKSSCVPSQYFITLNPTANLPADSDEVYTLANTNTTLQNLANFCFAYSLKKYSKDGILDGQNLTSSSTFLQMTLSVGPPNNVTVFNIAKMDIVYIIDSNGNIQVRM